VTEAKPLKVTISSTTLENGLEVVIAPDATAPVVTVGIYYKIGFRLEPQGRSGFAHLFEHMMFQGSENLGKMEFIKLVQSNGGVLNGSTRFDFTNYFEIVPSNALETALGPKSSASPRNTSAAATLPSWSPEIRK
jgi:zinc protease